MQETYIVVLVTAKNITEAKKVSKVLLNKKLIACVNIVKEVQSLFWWQGKVNNEKESLLVIKTKKSFFSEIVKAVKSVHSYSVPEVIALPIVDGQRDYLDWIDDTVK